MGRARPHHVLPASGWMSYPIAGPASVPGAVARFRLAYERAAMAKTGPSGDSPSGDSPSGGT